MKNTKPAKSEVVTAATQVVSAKDMQAMVNYLKNFDLKYRGTKNSDASKK